MDKKHITMSMIGIGASRAGTTFEREMWIGSSNRLKYFKDNLVKDMKKSWKSILSANCRCTKEFRYYIAITIKYPGQTTIFMNIIIDPNELK